VEVLGQIAERLRSVSATVKQQDGGTAIALQHERLPSTNDAVRPDRSSVGEIPFHARRKAPA